MNRILVCAALAFAITTGAVSAQLRNFVAVCGDPNAAPRDVVLMCQNALATNELGPKGSAQVRVNLGIGFFELGQYSDAVAEYTRGIETAPRMVALYMNRAKAYEKLRRLSEAAADYDTALRIDRNAADVYMSRGVMLLSHGDPGRSVKDFSKVIELEPSWTGPYFNRGVAQFRLGDNLAAERDFSIVLQRNSSDAGAYLNRGRARAALGRADAGLDFDRALAIEPEWGGGWFARGQFFDANGNREAANQDFLRAYELGYPDPWLIQRVREISG